MKKLAVFTVSVLFIGSGGSLLAQTQSGPRTQGVNELLPRFQQVLSQLDGDLVSGKLTKAQGVEVQHKISSVIHEEKQFWRKNKKHKLTDVQKQQLNSELDQIGKSL
jgi:hypothetical protein